MKENILDLTDAMERVQNDEELFRELLDIFTEDFHLKREEILRALKEKNFFRIKELAHSLKGAAGNISAKAVHLSLAKLEQMVERKEGEQALLALLATIDQQFSQLKEFIDEYKKKPG